MAVVGSHDSMSSRRSCTVSPQSRSDDQSTNAKAQAIDRRAALFIGSGLALSAMLPSSAARAEDEVALSSSSSASSSSPAPPPASAGKVAVLSDPILAYTLTYPSETVSGKPLRMVTTHEPEKYSSAAPLTADARQRIVCELIDLRNFVTVSMTVGPAAGVLKERPPAEWRAREVASTVLIDRSTARVTNGQRVALNDVEEAHVEDRQGGRVFVYEHLSQGSPTPLERSKETYRHALAVTAVRPGMDGTPYLFTLNLSCRQEMWDDLQPVFQRCVDSFKLDTPSAAYIPPDQNPWLFF